jgi:hypothetical protein
MTVIAIIALVFCVLLLMVSQGVGPFANQPLEQFYFAFRKLSPIKQKLLITPASLIALLASLILIGFIQF